MKISQLLKEDRLTLSIEVFPPKTDTVFESVKTATEVIAKLMPSFMSVTYGAGGGTSRYTLKIAENIQKKYGVPALAHLTCVSSSKQTVHKQIEDILNAGIENIMALRGDIPAGMEDADRSYWDYNYACELIKEIKDSGHDFCIGAACYPEIHPESENRMSDILHLKERLTLPGIMPITNAKQVERAVKLSGCYVPQRFLSLVDKFGSSPETMKQAGIAYATDQIIDLYANGIRNVHLYSMNKPDVAEKIMNNISGIIR